MNNESMNPITLIMINVKIKILDEKIVELNKMENKVLNRDIKNSLSPFDNALQFAFDLKEIQLKKKFYEEFKKDLIEIKNSFNK